MQSSTKRHKRIIRHNRVRAKVVGTSERPRLSIFRSNQHLWVQMIDDVHGKTLVAVSDREVAKSKKGKVGRVARAEVLGELIARKAGAVGITRVVCDRGGYRYHGRVRAVAEGVRKAGLLP